MNDLPHASGWFSDPRDSRYRRFFDGRAWTRRRVIDTALSSSPPPPFRDPASRKVLIIGEPPSIYVTDA